MLRCFVKVLVYSNVCVWYNWKKKREFEKKVRAVIIVYIFVYIFLPEPTNGKIKQFLKRLKSIFWTPEISLPPIPILTEEAILVLKLKVSGFASRYLVIDVDQFLLKYVADVRACKAALKRCAKSGLIPSQKWFYKRKGFICIPYYLKFFNWRWGGEKLFQIDTHGIILSKHDAAELTPYIKAVIADASAGLY
jgi:hypothetical protein